MARIIPAYRLLSRGNPVAGFWQIILENWEITAMTQDDRDVLELLKMELDFIEKGGYGRSVRTPWLPKSVFQDSISCLNYDYTHHAHPCAECRLFDFVGPED